MKCSEKISFVFQINVNEGEWVEPVLRAGWNILQKSLGEHLWWFLGWRWYSSSLQPAGLCTSCITFRRCDFCSQPRKNCHGWCAVQEEWQTPVGWCEMWQSLWCQCHLLCPRQYLCLLKRSHSEFLILSNWKVLPWTIKHISHQDYASLNTHIFTKSLSYAVLPSFFSNFNPYLTWQTSIQLRFKIF